MPQLDSDAFTYADGALATVSAAKWTDAGTGQVSGGSDNRVVSNAIQGLAVANVDRLSVITAWTGSTTDQYSAITLTNTGSAVAFCGPCIHMNALGTFYVFEMNCSGTDSRFSKCVTGAYGVISQFALQFTTGDICLLQWVSGTLTVFKNGVNSGSVADSSIASGKPGIRTWNNDAGVTPKFDSWTAGDFSASGGKPTTYYAQQTRKFMKERHERERLIERAYRETILRKAA